ncbi:MAG: DUF4185 domain-containing protein [Clostridia bacterium]|nr:DUF4185 domain-containing protein [Clostridia bacterium]
MKKIKEIRFVANITGENETGKWDVYGTDLGVPVYSPTLERMYFLFGDTFGRGEVDSSEKSNWRGTVAGYTDDFDFTAGINWHGFLADEKGDARQLVAAHYSPNADKVERTKISQGGIEIDGALYVFYESINHWGPYASGLWYLNFNGTLKSTDGGKSFEKVYDLTWVEPTEDLYRLEVAGRLATETMDMQPSGIWQELHECGILLQSNVSFFGNWRTRYRAIRMVSKSEINFLGSDCHNMKYRRPNWDKLPGSVRERICASDTYLEFVRQLADK